MLFQTLESDISSNVVVTNQSKDLTQVRERVISWVSEEYVTFVVSSSSEIMITNMVRYEDLFKKYPQLSSQSSTYGNIKRNCKCVRCKPSSFHTGASSDKSRRILPFQPSYRVALSIVGDWYKFNTSSTAWVA